VHQRSGLRESLHQRGGHPSAQKVQIRLGIEPGLLDQY
jgi:hypothetical protein